MTDYPYQYERELEGREAEEQEEYEELIAWKAATLEKIRELIATTLPECAIGKSFDNEFGSIEDAIGDMFYDVQVKYNHLG